MKLKNLTARIFFCLPFIAVVFYIHSYNGELINNAKVRWQYLQDDKGKIYLALDVYAPSGVKIEGIFSRKGEITNCWRLINYPDWYKGKENFEKIGEFREILHPYLPYNNDFNILYTTGWYTFLYEWKRPVSIPPESSIKVKYQNVATGNFYKGKYVSGMRVISKIAEKTVDGPIINLQMLYPSSYAYEHSPKNGPKVVLDNLVAVPNSSGYILETSSRDDYGISIQDERGNIIDSLKGFVRWDSENASQVYFKTDELPGGSRENGLIDFIEAFRHLAAVIFMIYFALICRSAGLLFVRWRDIVLDGYLEKVVIPTFLGIIFLTYLFFLIGILKLLYFSLLFVVLLILLFLGYESGKEWASYIKEALINEFNKIRVSPWRVLFLLLLVFMLFYNFSYCFLPATYVDGAGDIVNSYLPNLNDYIISHSFKAPIQNSTNGLNSQAADILRTVMMIFIGETGIYLLSFLYLLLIFGAIYLIGKKIFAINGMLVYLTALLFLSANIFTEALHFGKFYTTTLSFLLISLYASCFSDHNRNYTLPALFFAFLTSQFAFFFVTALTYYLFIFGCDFYKHRTIKTAVLGRHTKSLIVFCALCAVFYLKLIIEVGVCLPPGIISKGVGDFFSNLNSANDLYKYIDNNYIRHFYDFHMLSVDQYSVTFVEYLKLTLLLLTWIDYNYIFLFFPLLLIKPGKYKIFYILEILAITCWIMFFFPEGNSRVKIYFIYPIVVLQMAIVNEFLSRFVMDRFFRAEELDLEFKLRGRSLKLSSVFCFREVINTLRERSKLCIILNYNDAKFRLDKTIDRFFNLKVMLVVLLLLILPYFIFKDFPGGFFRELPDEVKTRKFKWANLMLLQLDHRTRRRNQPEHWFWKEAVPVVWGIKSKYEYLQAGNAHWNFDHAMLIRQYSDIEDKILIVPVRFHSHTMRHITARHALGSVIYQKDISKIMADLEKLNINYLSYIPIHYGDYNPFYTPIFEDDTFYKYFKLLFSDNGRKFYKIIHNGTNTEYTPSPYSVKGLPFIPMMKAKEV